MPLSNPRLLIDNTSTTVYTLGRRGRLAVDISNFAGGDLRFKLYQLYHRGLNTWKQVDGWTVRVDEVGAGPTTISIPVRLCAHSVIMRGIKGTCSR